MKALPQQLVPYRRTPTFTETTVPKGLLADHNTREGVWGLLTVEIGEIAYVITEAGEEEEITVRPGEPGVIAPEQRHHVRPEGAVSFYVQFLK